MPGENLGETLGGHLATKIVKKGGILSMSLWFYSSCI